MGEIYCCSRNSRPNLYDESNNKLINKNDFIKDYIIINIDMESSI